MNELTPSQLLQRIEEAKLLKDRLSINLEISTVDKRLAELNKYLERKTDNVNKAVINPLPPDHLDIDNPSVITPKPPAQVERELESWEKKLDG